MNADVDGKEIPTSVRQHVYDRYAFLLELSRSTFRGFMLQSPETRTSNGRRLARSHAPRSLQRDDVLESAVPTVPKIRVADEWLWANQMVVKDAKRSPSAHQRPWSHYALV